MDLEALSDLKILAIVKPIHERPNGRLHADRVGGAGPGFQ